MKKKRVIIGLSGGVDSSVAAYLLKEQGYEVIGLFMKNWHDESVTLSKECPWLEDSNDAMLVAEKLCIPFQTVDLSKEYKERIIDYMFDEYSKGRTPNPDILCNREIKFDVFLKIALSLEADYVATGHYCQKDSFNIDSGKEVYRLLAGKDKSKDQSYFLCQLSQKQLSNILFPIGHLNKEQVRKIAQKQNLVTAEKKDSQGLCFVGKVRLPDFLQQQLKPKTGKIIEIPNDSSVYFKPENFDNDIITRSRKFRYEPSDGIEVGQHNGAHFYTIGQRKGLGVGGNLKPLFIIDTDVDNNTIYVGQGKVHPGLFRFALRVSKSDIHWIRNDLRLNSGENLSVVARIRYRQTLQEATLFQTENTMYISFKNPQFAITSGQFVAWYKEKELVGSGVIT
ncbi:MAG: tRNA 2-thiouridine(34) synthase MnmA [Flavobacteriaceae bacterium TMED179]|nr:MAG: tRNA 2-thiouridine(34) synthase MnmA [Flavobacteriaceae bacterium TMED179]|tara:strand:+ start:54589 stop:55773 length:1185 start_codon:yes stop_codon:yes gene_type:complete